MHERELGELLRLIPEVGVSTVNVQSGVLDHIRYGDEIAKLCSRCGCKLGVAALTAVLLSPTTDVALLRSRGDDIGRVADGGDGEWSPPSIDQVDSALQLLEEDSAEAELLNTLFFDHWSLEPLNRWWAAMTAVAAFYSKVSAALSFLSPIYALLVPYFVLWARTGVRIPFAIYLSVLGHSASGASDAVYTSFGSMGSVLQFVSLVGAVLLYLQTTWGAFSRGQDIQNLCARVVRRMEGAAECYNALARHPRAHDEDYFWRWIPRSDSSTNPSAIRRGRVTPGKSKAVEVGHALSDYRRLDRDSLRETLRRLAVLDAIRGLASAVSDGSIRRASFGGPGILFRGLRRHDAPVPNDVGLAPCRGRGVLLVAGGKLSGKSSLLRSFATGAIFAQTIGWAQCDEALVRPMEYLCAAWSEDQGGFQGEIQRVGTCMEVATGEPAKYGLVLLDEVFGGGPCALACATRTVGVLSSCPGCILVVAAESEAMGKLVLETPGSRSLTMGGFSNAAADRYRSLPAVYSSGPKTLDAI